MAIRGTAAPRSLNYYGWTLRYMLTKSDYKMVEQLRIFAYSNTYSLNKFTDSQIGFFAGKVVCLQVMKVYGGGRDITLLIFNLSTGWVWSTSRPGHFSPGVRNESETGLAP